MLLIFMCLEKLVNSIFPLKVLSRGHGMPASSEGSFTYFLACVYLTAAIFIDASHVTALV